MSGPSSSSQHDAEVPPLTEAQNRIVMGALRQTEAALEKKVQQCREAIASHGASVSRLRDLLLQQSEMTEIMSNYSLELACLCSLLFDKYSDLARTQSGEDPPGFEAGKALIAQVVQETARIAAKTGEITTTTNGIGPRSPPPQPSSSSSSQHSTSVTASASARSAVASRNIAATRPTQRAATAPGRGRGRGGGRRARSSASATARSAQPQAGVAAAVDSEAQAAATASAS